VPSPSPPQTGLVDYDKLEEKALEFRPKLIIAGGSAYTREWDYKRFREIADRVGPTCLVSTGSGCRYTACSLHVLFGVKGHWLANLSLVSLLHREPVFCAANNHPVGMAQHTTSAAGCRSSLY
jgi:hypothetical protein